MYSLFATYARSLVVVVSYFVYSVLPDTLRNDVLSGKFRIVSETAGWRVSIKKAWII